MDFNKQSAHDTGWNVCINGTSFQTLGDACVVCFRLRGVTSLAYSNFGGSATVACFGRCRVKFDPDLLDTGYHES